MLRCNPFRVAATVTRGILGAALLSIAACAGVSGTSRSGVIHDVRFDEHMAPMHLWVQPGDEVRWVNQRNLPVTVEFLGDALDDVTCQRGFDDRIGRQQEMATIEPNESASLCFGDPGVVTYNARMDSALAGGKTIESGTIRVGR
jgi:plastocyanin